MVLVRALAKRGYIGGKANSQKRNDKAWSHGAKRRVNELGSGKAECIDHAKERREASNLLEVAMDAKKSWGNTVVVAPWARKGDGGKALAKRDHSGGKAKGHVAEHKVNGLAKCGKCCPLMSFPPGRAISRGSTKSQGKMQWQSERAKRSVRAEEKQWRQRQRFDKAVSHAAKRKSKAEEQSVVSVAAMRNVSKKSKLAA